MPTQKIAHYVALAALFIIPVFPLIVANGFFFPFITGKAFYFRILVEIAFAAWVILAFLDARYRPKLNGITVAVTLFALVTLIADLLGVNPIRSIVSNFERMEGWLVIAHLWMFYIAATGIFGTGISGRTLSDEERRRVWHRWLNVSMVVALVVAVYGLFQLFGWAPTHQGANRIDASLGNSAYMAVYMLFHAFLAAYFFFVARARRIAGHKFLIWAYPILAVLFAFIIFQTQTRGTILGVLGGVILALALYAIFGGREKGRQADGGGNGAGKNGTAMWCSISAGIIVAIALIGVIFWLNRDSAFVRNQGTLNRLATISWNDTKTQARGYVWPMAIEGFTERPIFGWGQENFNYVFNANYDARMWSQEQWFDRAHNVFLDWLIASGAVGLIVYLSLYVLVVIGVWKSSLTIAEKSILTGLIAAYAGHNAFVFDNLASYVMFFSMLGFVSSLREGKAIRWLSGKNASEDAASYIIAPIMVVLLVAGVYFLSIRPIQANTRLIDALRSCTANRADLSLFESALSVDSYMANQEIREQLISCATQVTSLPYSGAVQQAFAEAAYREMEAQISATPEDARAYMFGGSFLNAIGQAPLAVSLLEKAHELSPEKQTIVFQLASSYVASGQAEKAVAVTKAAYESDPTFEDAKINYAIAMIVAGKEDEARNLFEDDPALFETGRMANAFVAARQFPQAIAIYRKLTAASPSNIDLRFRLAQIYHLSGNTARAVEIMRAIAAERPEYKVQIEAEIQRIQAERERQ